VYLIDIGGSSKVYLPAAGNTYSGFKLILKNVQASNQCDVHPTGESYVDNIAHDSYTLYQNSSVTLLCTGALWIIV